MSEFFGRKMKKDSVKIRVGSAKKIMLRCLLMTRRGSLNLFSSIVHS